MGREISCINTRAVSKADKSEITIEIQDGKLKFFFRKEKLFSIL